MNRVLDRASAGLRRILRASATEEQRWTQLGREAVTAEIPSPRPEITAPGTARR